jgi:acetyl-CoA acetyltransferase
MGERAWLVPYGVISPPQRFAMRVQRYMHEHGIRQEALRAIAPTSYHHAQNNPRAVMFGKPLDADRYDASRWIVEPFHLFDCCMENDGAAAIVLVDAERVADFQQKPVYVLGVASGSSYRFGAQAHNSPDYGSANFGSVAPDVYRMAGVSPADVGTVQFYENFTGGVLMALAEHGFFRPEDANEFLTLENLVAESGKLPLNTSGGNLAECYMHGFELVLEAVRQVRGTSSNQVVGKEVALVAGGPMVAPTSDLILGSRAVL